MVGGLLVNIRLISQVNYAIPSFYHDTVNTPKHPKKTLEDLFLYFKNPQKNQLSELY